VPGSPAVTLPWAAAERQPGAAVAIIDVETPPLLTFKRRHGTDVAFQ
jgi:hypothetical protein